MSEEANLMDPWAKQIIHSTKYDGYFSIQHLPEFVCLNEIKIKKNSAKLKDGLFETSMKSANVHNYVTLRNHLTG